MRLKVPTLSLVVLIGPVGSGKSTFVARHFLPTEVVSSDRCRALVSDDEDNQAATPDAFEVLHILVDKRLARGRLTVVDATNVTRSARRPLLRLAEARHVQPVAVVLDLPERVCVERLDARPERGISADVVRRHAEQMHRSIGALEREGFDRVYVLRTPEEVDAVEVEREPLPVDRRHDRGPFDVIGDVHGCVDELVALLERLGYDVAGDRSAATHPEGRRAVFLGDLVDRGPDTPAVVRLVMGMLAAGSGLAVAGNHEHRLARALRGGDVEAGHGLTESLVQLGGEPGAFLARMIDFLDGLPGHLVLDRGRLVVAHAGLPRDMHGRVSSSVRSFALYGETAGESDAFLPSAEPGWARRYRARPLVVYGHVAVAAPQLVRNTVNIDTGCVFGGRLTALRYPESELVDVPAARTYYEPARRER